MRTNYKINEIGIENEKEKRMTEKTVLDVTYADILGVFSSFLCIIGTFLPWGFDNRSPSFTSNGFNTDYGFGIIFFSIFAIILIYLRIRKIRQVWSIQGVIVLGLLITIFSIMTIAEILHAMFAWNEYLVIGIGLYLTVIGGIGLIISGLWNHRAKH